MRIGQGYDLHLLVPQRDLLLGGHKIDYHLGEKAHSDGDVLIHAIIDSLFVALALGDIGSHFPPSDIKWKDISSVILLEKARDIIFKEGYKIINIDCTIVLEKPKINPHVENIRKSISKILNIDISQISVKGKTKEGVDATGENRAIEAQVISLLDTIN